MSNIISGTSVWISSTQGNNEGVAHFYSISYNSCDSYTTLMRETRSEKVAKECFLVVRDKLKKKFHSSSYINTKISFHYIKTLLKILIAFMLLTNATATELFSQIIIRSSAELFFWYIENVSSRRTFNFQNFHWCFCLIWTYVEFSNIGVHKYFLEFAKIDILLDFSRWYSM